MIIYALSIISKEKFPYSKAHIRPTQSPHKKTQTKQITLIPYPFLLKTLSQKKTHYKKLYTTKHLLSQHTIHHIYKNNTRTAQKVSQAANSFFRNFFNELYL